MLPTTITTEELRHLTGDSKAQLVELEQGGIIKREAKNVWPIATVPALVARLRERGQRPIDDDRTRFEAARAGREKLKLMKECNEVVYLREFKQAIDAIAFCVLQRLSPLASRIGKQDLALRRLVESEVRAAQALMSSDMKAQADALENTGKAL
jgi:hypothetical protein